MIEHIQKYKVIIMIALVAVGAGFVLGGSSLMRRASGGGRPVLKIAGRTYDDMEYRNLGASSFELISSLARSGDFGLYQFLMGLSTGATNQNDAVEKFFVGRMILRQAKEEFGVYPGEDEISDYIRGLRAFVGKEGKFDEETYRNFIEKGIGRLGMTESDLRALAADVLASKKINAILGSGLGVNRDIVAHNLALDNQQITGELARLDLDPFEAKIEPTEEQIKAYWENLQDAFTTEPTRKFSYLLVAPDMPADTEADKPPTPESIADAAASDEVKKAAAKKKDEEKAKRSAELAEVRRKKQLELDALMNDFTDDLDQQKGSNFEELAKKNQWEIKTTQLFPRSAPPKELDIKLRSSSRGGKLVDDLFRIELTSDPLSKFSQPIAIGENQWIVARLDEEIKARPKTYEEARNEARAKYITEQATAAMKTAVTEAVTKMQAALAAGKSFADAAKEAGIDKTKEFTNVTSSYRPDSATEPQNLFETARNIDPNAIAEPILEADRAFILHIAKREVVKQENAATRLDNEVKARSNENETVAFTGWITTRTEAAKVEQLYRK
ncbi:MAG: SurA N-terminal domain-containing protein [Verrucomicrobia bacterium]|nr:SurA N-terminal domain-containing protein [Verrucomicrobiota bacterium]